MSAASPTVRNEAVAHERRMKVCGDSKLPTLASELVKSLLATGHDVMLPLLSGFVLRQAHRNSHLRCRFLD